VWTRSHVWTDAQGVSFEQRERFFFARVAGFDAKAVDLEAHEATVFRGLRWWTLDQLEASQEELSPSRLARLVRRLLADGPPARPVEVGV
jgi:hypothetical protein